MKIVNIKRFFTSIFLLISFIIVFLLFIGNNSFSHQELTQKEIYIVEGDTLWTIARKEKEENPYYSEKDIRDIIYEIKKLKQFEENHNLMPGEKLIIYGK